MKRKDGLDFLKFICAFMVVCIHVKFPKTIGTIIEPINKIAVPVFFMISGFFYSCTKENCGEVKQIKKIAELFIGANLLYFLYNLIMNFLYGRTVIEFFNSFANLNALNEFVFLNESPFRAHLWYLGSILYILIILFFFEKRYDRKKLYLLIPFLLMINMFLGKYALMLFGREFSYCVSRNFLFIGLPYFLIGDIIFNSNSKIKPYMINVLFYIFIVSILLERFILFKINYNVSSDYDFSTIFLAVFAFLFAITYGNEINNQLYKKCCFIGSKLSVGIYILHPIFKDVLLRGVEVVAYNDSIKFVFDYMLPFLVFFVSIFASWVLYIWSGRIMCILHKSKATD